MSRRYDRRSYGAPGTRPERAFAARPARSPGGPRPGAARRRSRAEAGFTLLEVLLAAGLLALLLGSMGSVLSQQVRDLRRSRADAEAVGNARLAASLIVEAARRYDFLEVTGNGKRLRGRSERPGNGDGGSQWDLILSLDDRRPGQGSEGGLTRDTFWYNRTEGALERCYTNERWDRAVEGLGDIRLEVRKSGNQDRWVELLVTAEPPGATGPYTVSTWLRLERPRRTAG